MEESKKKACVCLEGCLYTSIKKESECEYDPDLQHANVHEQKKQEAVMPTPSNGYKYIYIYLCICVCICI